MDFRGEFSECPAGRKKGQDSDKWGRRCRRSAIGGNNAHDPDDGFSNLRVSSTDSKNGGIRETEEQRRKKISTSNPLPTGVSIIHATKNRARTFEGTLPLYGGNFGGVKLTTGKMFTVKKTSTEPQNQG